MDISLIITNYNREHYLPRAINSCLDQLISDIEVETVVVDDASTDESINIINSFSKKIHFVQHTLNQGVASASNSGIKASQGRYIMRVDSDDFLSTYACQVLYMILEANPEYGYVYCDHVRVNEIGKKEELVRLDTPEKLYEHGAGILFRKEVLYNINLYDETLRNAEDYDLLLRLTKEKIKGFYLPVPLYRYFIHGENLTLDNNRFESVRNVRRYHGLK